ncbi:MAG: GAF domain-containing protein [Myxococcales bacterium]|nr:GAF domain-containing protein [Myxococcales bacterium]
MSTTRLERAYRTFVGCHDVVSAATTEQEIFDGVCRLAVDELGYALAWVGLTSEEDTRVRPVAQAGFEEGYLSSIDITWSDDARGRGPTGRAIRERTPQVAQDIASDERFAPWREDALRRGYASSAALPLCNGMPCFGALNLYAAEPDAFDDEELALLEEVALDMVLGVERMRARGDLQRLAAQVDLASRAEAAAAAVSAVAHDVSNMLTAATLSIESARAAPTASAREAALGEAMNAASSAATMVRRLTSLARRAADDERAHVDQIVSGATLLLMRLAPEATIEVALGATGTRAAIAALDLERILINLVVNAHQAVGPAGRIGITTAIEAGVERAGLGAGSYVALSVSDDGEGIAPDVLPRIFEPFFTTKGLSGTGLGLHAVRQLARNAGGDVLVESTLGEGTRFTVLLPVLTAEAYADAR